MSGFLVIDDYPDVHKELDWYKELWEIDKIFHAYSGEEGMEVWETNRQEIDVIFLDHRFEVPDSEGNTYWGYDIARKLLAKDPDLVIIVMTGWSYNDAVAAYEGIPVKGVKEKAIGMRFFGEVAKEYLGSGK